MSDEKMREEFEAAITKDSMEAGFDEPNFSRTRCYPESYWDESIQTAWWAWQASREALVVELPKQVGFDKPFTGMPMDEMKADNSYNLALSRCRSAIEAAGVRVKT